MISSLKQRVYDVQKKRQSGFTLIELLVTITIFVVLTGVVLLSQNNFNNTILLTNLSYDTALTIRQAQTYGVNTRESSAGTFATSSGVYFDTTSGTGNKLSFILFADTNNDQGSDINVNSCPANSTECIQKYSIKNGSYVRALCAGTDSLHCFTTQKLDILFTRPNPDALIYSQSGASGPIIFTTPQSYAQITVSSANGATSSIIVTSVGQIYVQK
jgi:prepilin-type N-terminal cleavage/methylation domain-containing protein